MAQLKKERKVGSSTTKDHKNGRTAQPSLYWGTKEMITLNTNSEHCLMKTPGEAHLFHGAHKLA